MGEEEQWYCWWEWWDRSNNTAMGAAYWRMVFLRRLFALQSGLCTSSCFLQCVTHQGEPVTAGPPSLFRDGLVRRDRSSHATHGETSERHGELCYGDSSLVTRYSSWYRNDGTPAPEQRFPDIIRSDGSGARRYGAAGGAERNRSICGTTQHAERNGDSGHNVARGRVTA